jgi:hypothetical protein
MGTEDSSKDLARVIDFSAAKKAKEDALDEPMNNPGPMHPAFRMAQIRKAREERGE